MESHSIKGSLHSGGRGEDREGKGGEEVIVVNHCRKLIITVAIQIVNGSLIRAARGSKEEEGDDWDFV